MTNPLNPYTKKGRAALETSIKSRLGPTMRIEELTTAELLRIEERHGALAKVLEKVKKAFPDEPKDGWETSSESCPKCGYEHVEYRVYDDGPESDYRYRCNNCEHSWWAESDQ